MSKKKKRLLEEELRKRENEDLSKFDEAKQRNKKRLESAIKEKLEKMKKIKTEEEIKKKKEKKEKDLKKAIGLQKYYETKEMQKKDDKKEAIFLLNNNEIRASIDKYSEQIGLVFSHYLSQMELIITDDGVISLEIFNKFCAEFRVFSIVSEEQINQIFAFLTKKKSAPLLSSNDFEKSLILIADKGRANLGIDQPGVKPVETLLETCGIAIGTKDLRKKIKTLREKLPKPKKNNRKAVNFTKNNKTSGLRESVSKDIENVNKSIDSSKFLEESIGTNE